MKQQYILFCILIFTLSSCFHKNEYAATNENDNFESEIQKIRLIEPIGISVDKTKSILSEAYRRWGQDPEVSIVIKSLELNYDTLSAGIYFIEDENKILVVYSNPSLKFIDNFPFTILSILDDEGVEYKDYYGGK